VSASEGFEEQYLQKFFRLRRGRAMSTATTDRLLQHLRRLIAASGASGGSDRDLLDAFIATRDVTAFSTLVERHGAMVLGVCRRALGDVAAVEDVFQATFLVLARQAGAIRRRATVGGWLYGVAHRLARKALAVEARRRRHEREAAAGRPCASDTDPGWQELLDILDEELQRLPERWRAPLLACYLEGRTQDEAARELGWSLSTLRRRLARGRELLRVRMSRRGATLSASLFAGVLAPRSLAASVPVGLIQATVRLMTATDSGRIIPAAVAALAEESVGAAWPLHWKLLAAVLLAVGAAGAWGLQPAAEKPAPPPPTTAAPRSAPVVQRPATDLYGDPLPPGAIARMGTTAFRHMEVATALAYSPDGKWLATAANDYTVRVWDAATGREMHQFAISGVVYWSPGLAVSPDGKRLAATTGNGLLHVWDIATGKQEITQKVPAKGKFWIFFPGFRADGRAMFIFRGDADDEPFALHDVRTAVKFCPLNSTSVDARNLVLSPAGDVLAVKSDEHKIDLLAVDTGKVLRTLKYPDKELNTLVFNRDGRLLATCSCSRVRIWDPATGKELRQFAAPGPVPAGSLTMTLSPDGQMVALAGYADSSLRLVQVADGKERLRLDLKRVRSHSLAFSPDGRSLAALVGSEVCIWDTTTGKEWGADRVGHRDLVKALAYAPDGRRLVSSSNDGSACLWDARTGRQLRVLCREEKPVSGVAFSPDGSGVAIATAGKTMVFDAATGEQRLRFDARAGAYPPVAYSPDGRLLATAGDNGTVCLGRAADGVMVRTMTDGQGEIGAMAFSPDGRLLAVCHKEKLRLWDVATGKQMEPLEGEPYAYLLAFSPDGEILAAGGYETITLWRVATQKKIGATKVGPQDRLELHGLGYTPDGRMLVLSGWNQQYTERELRFWEVATCQKRFHITNPGGPVFAIAFSPDGRSMATGNSDSTVTVWDLAALPALPAPGKLSPADLNQLWTTLADVHAGKAFRALHTLAAVPQQAVPLLSERLKPVPRADAAKVKRLIAELDNDQFAVREKATAELAQLQESAKQALRQASDGELSTEGRRRVAQLLRKLAAEATSAEGLRLLRAVEVLERIGSPAARQVLKTLADGQPEARATEEAQAACRRLVRRTP
jgi:RNA polymerase sigma factor (sigma-70 family)